MGKRITYKNIFGMGLAVPAFSLVAIGNAQAQECAALPTCEEFGYLYTAEECAGQKYVKCPFDQTKYFCLGEDTSTNCQVGDILYSDKSCSSDVVSGKTPIAVVFNAEKRLAIGLKTTNVLWSKNYFDVPKLTNYSSETTALEDWSGKSNTLTVINYCSASSESCPAFEYVNTYTTAGTNAGDWYLPALGEVNNIYENITVLNRSLSLIGGTQLPTHYHWSSSEWTYYGAWFQSFSDGIFVDSLYGNAKNNSYNNVRPVLQF